MAKKKCSAGRTWDKLVNDCIPKEAGSTTVKTEPLSKRPLLAVVEQVREKAPAPSPGPVMTLGPLIWVFVVLATVGSLLVLVLWLIIYRRQSRQSSTTDARPGQEAPHKPPATILSSPSESSDVFPSAPEAPTPCSHLFPGAQTDSLVWQEGGPAMHAGKEEESRGQHVCSSIREHRIPLPATELGGTALVTTKTV